MKRIQRKSIVTLPEITGSISDTLNVEDKINNAPSINLVQMMAGVPEEGIIAYEGDEIPEGYEEVSNPNVYSTEEVKTNEVWIDGKTIYKKVFNLGLLGSESAILNYTVGTNVDTLIDLSGLLTDFAGNTSTMPASAENDTITSKLYGDSNSAIGKINIQFIRSAIGAWGNRYLIVTAKYTKTTD